MIWNTLLFVFLWSFVAGWISSSTMWSWAWFLRYALKSQIIFENETLRAFSVTIDSAMGVRLGFWSKTGGIFILIFGDLIEGDWWDGDLFVNPAHFIFYFVFGKEVVNWAIAMIMFDKLINLLCCYQQKSMQNQSNPMIERLSSFTIYFFPLDTEWSLNYPRPVLSHYFLHFHFFIL